LVAHALLRSSLSHYENLEPQQWSFEKNAYGRPEIWLGNESPPLRFNLSHTKGLVTCAITKSAAIGVDVENIKRSSDLLEVAKTSFTAKEIKDLGQLTGREWYQHSFHLWTLKEAFFKAKGKGLSMSLQNISFHFERRGAEKLICFDIATDEELTQNWQFAACCPTVEHCLAIALNTDKSMQLQTRWTVPGLGFKFASVSYISS